MKRPAIVIGLLVVAVGAADARIPSKTKRGPRDMLIVAGGDVAYPRGWMDRLVERQKNRMFDHVRGYARAGDLAFINLESPLTNAKFTLKKRWPIATPPHRLDYVLSGGFNMISLANNHMGDAGKQGIVDTLALLEKNKKKNKHLWWAGAGRTVKEAWEPTIIRVPGKKLKVVFHAFGYARTNLVPTPTSKRAISNIKKYKGKGDLTVVSVHMGREYKHTPSKGRAALYRRFIDAGADIVLGHHPHVIQGVEAYKSGIIFYSLGNFSFASKTKRHHKTGAKLYGMLPLIYIKNGRVERAEIMPMYVNNGESWSLNGKKVRPTDFKPQFVKGAFAREVLTSIKRWTEEIPDVHSRAKRALKIRGERAVVQVAR